MRILAIQNDETDPPHLAGKWLEEQGHEIVVLRAYAGEEVPSTVPDGIDALMPLGGHMGALDDHVAPWLVNERAMIVDATSEDVPIFAICLGAQLVAAALGGEVRRSPEAEIGIYEITAENVSDPVFQLEAGTIAAQWHEDIVTKLPEGAVRLAGSPLCENQVFKFGPKSYAVQFHPEIDASIIHTWEEHADNAFLESGKSSVESEVKAVESQLFEIWKPTVQRWGVLIQK